MRGLLRAPNRELVIDSATARHGAEQEWGLHAGTFGAAVDLSEDQLASTVTGQRWLPDMWPEAELELFDALDELCGRADLGPQSWAALWARYDDGQLVELLVLVGWYRIASLICNGLELDSEPWTAHFAGAADG